MLILFDFENIQNGHYQNVKRCIIKHFGAHDWAEAQKQGSVAQGHEDECIPNWNTNVEIFTVPPAPQAADLKLIELAAKYKGNRCIVITNDNALYEAIRAQRIAIRKALYPHSRAAKRTCTEQIFFSQGVLKRRKKNGDVV
jgi:hypothetical protein